MAEYTTSSEKKYPLSTPEVAKMLNLSSGTEAGPAQGHGIAPASLPVKDLPVAEEGQMQEQSGQQQKQKEQHEKEKEAAAAEDQGAGKPNAGRAIKTLLPYLAIFVLGIFLYYFFFSRTDFSGIFKLPARNAQSAQQNELKNLQEQSLESYQAWIAQFYYDVSDPKILDPEADNSGNGLTNFQKYLLNLNPKSYDTLGLGMADSEALARGLNPLSGSPLNERQKQIVDKYFDMEIVMNRLTLAHLQLKSQVAGARVENGGSDSYRSFGNAGSGQQGNNAENSGIVYENLDINTDIPGRLEIPSLKINVPVMWTKEPKDFDRDLRSGVVHYPGTAMPGQIGTAYISGHSSNYLWAKGDFNKIFASLGDLADNTSFKITVVQKDGRDAVLHYVVKYKKEFDAKDQEQFRNSGQSLVALSTCWPVGTTARRLVAFGQLTQIEKK